MRSSTVCDMRFAVSKLMHRVAEARLEAYELVAEAAGSTRTVCVLASQYPCEVLGQLPTIGHEVRKGLFCGVYAGRPWAIEVLA